DGVAAEAFNLVSIGQQIIGNENVSGSYYLSESAAENQTEAEEIDDPTAYENDPALNEIDEGGLVTNVQIIWLRLDSDAQGNFCSTVVPIALVVEPNPEINPEGDPFAYTLCEDPSTTDGSAAIPSPAAITENLFSLDGEDSLDLIPILDPNADQSQDLNDYEITYHLNEEDAEAGTNSLNEGYVAQDGQSLFIRVEAVATGCHNINNIAEVVLIIEPRPAINETAANEYACANESDAQAQDNEIGSFDLTSKDEEIDPNDDGTTEVTYYAGVENYENGNPIADPATYETEESPQLIIAEVTDLVNGCASATTVSFELRVNPLPLVNISDEAIICIGENGEITQAPTLDTELSEEDYEFEWTYNGEVIGFTGSAYTAEEPGVYEVTVTDVSTSSVTSCEATSTAEVIESSGPAFEVNVLSTAFDGNHSIEITNVEGDGDYEFSLDGGPWQVLEGESLTFTDVPPGDRVIIGRDRNGCGEVAIPVSLIDYPQFFTPNEDGYNDTWNIIGLADQPNAKIYIFDRYGKLLKQLSPSGQGWDGTYNGKPMPSNDYWFRVEYTEPSSGAQASYKANFTLKR
ncbi:MAG: T9SS type B sorting domain-containing protein, partial [Bacteroidota bacterium]